MRLRIIITKQRIHVQIIVFVSFISLMSITLNPLTASREKGPFMIEQQNGKHTISKHPSVYSGRFMIISENALVLYPKAPKQDE